jgi:hypothetical protein
MVQEHKTTTGLGGLPGRGKLSQIPNSLIFFIWILAWLLNCIYDYLWFNMISILRIWQFNSSQQTQNPSTRPDGPSVGVLPPDVIFHVPFATAQKSVQTRAPATIFRLSQPLHS